MNSNRFEQLSKIVPYTSYLEILEFLILIDLEVFNKGKVSLKKVRTPWPIVNHWILSLNKPNTTRMVRKELKSCNTQHNKSTEILSDLVLNGFYYTISRKSKEYEKWLFILKEKAKFVDSVILDSTFENVMGKKFEDAITDLNTSFRSVSCYKGDLAFTEILRQEFHPWLEKLPILKSTFMLFCGGANFSWIKANIKIERRRYLQNERIREEMSFLALNMMYDEFTPNIIAYRLLSFLTDEEKSQADILLKKYDLDLKPKSFERLTQSEQENFDKLGSLD